MEPFVPEPIDISNVILSHFAMEVHEKLAENLHELWAMRKIELGWSLGEVILFVGFSIFKLFGLLFKRRRKLDAYLYCRSFLFLSKCHSIEIY